jgi:hypothetical protein
MKDKIKAIKDNLRWIIIEKDYNRNKKKFNDPLRILYSNFGFAFEQEWECIKLMAKDVEEGDFLIMNNNKLFQVDCIEEEFSSDEAATKYPDDAKDEDMDDEDTIYSFIDEDNGGANGVSLNNIPFDAKFLTIRIKN